ncbi:mechanosensitive ion channel family protein [Candidatus Omnitrophota bacterium]
MQRKLEKLRIELFRTSLFPILLFVLLSICYFLYKVKVLPLIPQDLHFQLKKYFVTILILCFAFIMQRMIGAIAQWYKNTVATITRTRLDDEFVPLVRRICKILVWVLALLVILPFYGINISALVTTLGVASLAIALAAQDTIANIISGFLIMIDRPFRIGDEIKLPSGEEVLVIDIGIRRSKFVSEDKKAIIIIPNIDLSKSKIVNFTYGEERLESKA